MNPFTFPFDATQVDPTQGSGALPIGRHPVVVTSSEVKATSTGTDGMLVLELSIIDGPNKGQTGAHRLNLYHSNPKTCEIAQKQLSAICHSTGRYRLNAFAELNNIPFLVEVAYQKGHGPEPVPQGPENKGYTEVKRVFDINGNEPGKKPVNTAPQPQAQSFAPAPQAQAPAPAAPAWNNPAQTQPTAPAAAPGWAAPAQGQAPAGFPPPSAPAAPSWNQQAPAAGAPGKPAWAT